MERTTLEGIVAEIESYMDRGSTRLWDNEALQPASNYADPARQAQERQLIRSAPIIVGHASRLKAAGDFLTHDATGVPILVIRQDDGSLRALLNICTHRGARLCAKPEGQRRTLVCPYHAWTFRIDGSLRGIPRAEGFPHVEPADFALQQLPVQERHGFIWVVPTPGAGIDVAAHLGPLDAEIASYGAADMVLQREDRLPCEMNWKFVLDGFLEVYHFATLHARSIAPYFHGNFSPFDAFGRHGRLVGVRASFDKVRGQPKGDIPTDELIRHLAVNYFIFPNTVLVWQGDHFESWTAFPGERPDQSLTHVQSVVPRAMAQSEFEARWDRNWKIMIDTVVEEDWAMSRTIQDGVHAMPRNRIVFGRNEPGLQHFHGQLAQAIAQAAAA